MKRCFEVLATYGAAAKPLLPQLNEIEKSLVAHSEAKSLKPQIEQLRGLIKSIESSTETVELRDLN
jgi:hypothetical protein